jgi:hypothetical protein
MAERVRLIASLVSETTRVIPCWQSTPELSSSVARLGLSVVRIRPDRLASGPVVVSLSGGLVRHLGCEHLRRWLPSLA